MNKYTEAMKEALATVDEQIIYHTLEFRHPGFIENGVVTAVRVVMDTMTLIAPLEANAPLHAGQTVEFVGLPFEFMPPSEEPTSNPQVTIKLDNVSQMLEPYLDIASNSEYPIEITYRPYLSGAINDGPQIPNPYTLIVTDVSSSVSDVSITAKMEDVTNKAFLWDNVTIDRFPSLNL